MTQSLDTVIESVMFIAQVGSDPANFSIKVKEIAADLARIDELKLFSGTYSNIEIDKPFTLSVLETQLVNLEELLMVVKYSF